MGISDRRLRKNYLSTFVRGKNALRIFALVCTSRGIQFKNRFFLPILKLQRVENVAPTVSKREVELAMKKKKKRRQRRTRSLSELLSAVFPLPPQDAHQNNNRFIAGLLPCRLNLHCPHGCRLRQRPQVPKNKYHIKSSGWAARAPKCCGFVEETSRGASLQDHGQRWLLPRPRLIPLPRRRSNKWRGSKW